VSIRLVGIATTLVVVLACSAEKREEAAPTFATPLAMQGGKNGVAPSLGARAAPGAPLNLETFTPLLALPEFSRAADAVEIGDFSAAAREVQTVVEKRGNDPAGRLLVGRMRENAGDVEGSLAAYDAASQAAWPLAPYAYAAAGRVLVRAGKGKEAQVRLEHVIIGGPLGTEARLLMADAARLVGDRAVELQLLRAHVAENPSDSLASVRLSELILDAHGPLPSPSVTTAATAPSFALSPGPAVAASGVSSSPSPSSRELAASGDAPATEPAIPVPLLMPPANSAAATPQVPPSGVSQAEAEEALVLARRAMSHAPSDVPLVLRARRVEERALLVFPLPGRLSRARPSAEDELARVEALLDAKQYEAARQASDMFLAMLGKSQASGDAACKAELLRGRAVAGLRQWGSASEQLGEVAKRCKDPDVHARALFLAGKYADSDKRYSQAVRYYEALEKDVPTHRLADDARLRAAQSYEELGDEAHFTELLSRMADDYPEGDMVLDGMFLLALHRIGKGDWLGATSVLERAAPVAMVVDSKRGLEFAGRERYFRARAWSVAGETQKSLDEYEAMVRELPLSYYMLNAYSRLSKADAARAARALSGALETSARAPFTFEHRPEFDDPSFARALELLRVGDVEHASLELDVLGLVRPDAAPALLWSVALLYERAGASKLSNDVARGLLTDWLARWPSGDWRRAWELAFPRPYHAIVERETAKTKVPEALVYAVMREESSFDPSAESPAKAYGLMQVIEPTARVYGKSLGVRIDANTLKRPSVSIAVGCRVLSDLGRTFVDNPLLAIPGYNAGPRPPRRWVDARPASDFDVWVEMIPYLETRRYMKRVLASRAAYAFLYSQSDPDGAVRLPVELTTR
jgi:soluble lytic murein transglycosylase